MHSSLWRDRLPRRRLSLPSWRARWPTGLVRVRTLAEVTVGAES